MPGLSDVEWLDPLVATAHSPELEREVRRETGSVPPHARYFGSCPWILRADVAFDVGCAHIDPLADLIHLIVSRDNSCRYCYGASRLFLRMGGLSDRQIEQLEHDVETARLEPRVSLAIDFARRVSRANPVPGAAERRALAAAGWHPEAIRELALYAGVALFHNRVTTLLALPPALFERAASRWWGGLLRFRYRRLLARMHTPPAGDGAADAEAASGPYAGLVRALGGLPHARVLRRVLADAWASPNLPPRTKALVFAVVARGLGSRSAEREVCRLLADEGMEPAAIAESLANLASPALDAHEAQILPYVRETLWYQPATVQRRGRALRERLGDARLLEAVGLAALANMVGRVSLAVEAE